MARGLRPSAGDVIYHVLNRGNGRRTIFRKPADAVAFLNLLHGLRQEIPVRLLAYCLMGNHWHLVLWPRGEGELSRFMHRLTVTHVRRYFQHYHDDAGGHLYQGRFKSFPVQDDPHLLTLCAYVEANALRAGLVARAEQWRWSSLHLLHGGRAAGVLHEWPTARPARADWIERVNATPDATELERMRTCVRRGRPFGREDWVQQICRALGLEFTLRDPGRPKKRMPGVDNET